MGSFITKTNMVSSNAIETILHSKNSTNQIIQNNISNINKATLAAGCFWGVELAFQRLHGVLKTQVGYTNGKKISPTYEEVCTGETGHVEAVEIVYDENILKYNTLLDTFWTIHNPTTLNRQKNDIGTQYRSGIYYHTEYQKQIAIESKKLIQEKYGKNNTIVTEIEKAQVFYPGESYHQQYLEKGGQCASKGCSDKIRCYG